MISARNVHDFLPKGLDLLVSAGIPMPSRAGNVLTYPIPVEIVYEFPTERVLFWPERDANPWLHIFESLWMLAGRNDLAFLTQFVKRFEQFSDDGHTLAGAYGHRWRKHFHERKATPVGVFPKPIDQIEQVVTLLKAEPFSRRAIITMFDPVEDLHTDEVSKDVPCNISICFRVIYGKRDEANRLDMTVINRSNDLIWGLAGANAVHMSILQEYIAAKLELVVGYFRTYTTNLHAYEDVFAKTYRGALVAGVAPTSNPYTAGEVTPYPLITNPTTWDRDLALFFEDPAAYGYDNPFFPQVAKPLWFAHKAYKKKDIPAALEIASQCQASDWRRAATEWLQRRMKP